MSKRFGSPLGGLVLIGVGLLFLADTLGFVSLDFGDLLRTWWPMIFVLVGIARLLEGQGRPAAGFFVLGALLQLAVLGMFERWNLRRWWPVILILLGASMVADHLRRRKYR